MAKSKTQKNRASVLARTLLAAVLTISLAPTVPAFAVNGNAQQDATGGDSAAAIADMLSSGDYEEGEAIAIIRADEQPGISAQVEQLAEVEGESVDLAVDSADQTESSVDDTAALRVQAAPASTYDVQLVVDHTRTTEQILRDLYNDPNVIAAEPNYSYEAAEALEGYGDADNASAASALQAASPAPLCLLLPSLRRSPRLPCQPRSRPALTPSSF